MTQQTQILTPADFDYELPQHLIAQTPIEPRDASRLLVVSRSSTAVEHKHFADLKSYLQPGDLLVLNQTRVIPARLKGHKVPTGGAVEVLLLRQIDHLTWDTIIGGRNIRRGAKLAFERNTTIIQAEVTDVGEGPQRTVRFDTAINNHLDQLGEVPLPPYIHEPLGDPERYQTVFSRHKGSAAAPTAGLHFTGDMLVDLQRLGITFAYCTLNIGLGTFEPVRSQHIEEHRLHSEWATLSARDAQLINEAKLAGRRIIAVGTTVVRTLESAAIISAGGNPATGIMPPDDFCPWRPVTAFEQETRLFIRPGFRFRITDAMVTNLHLPKSTLLMLVSAFLGRERTLEVYSQAVQDEYRFFSFGDAMLII